MRVNKLEDTFQKFIQFSIQNQNNIETSINKSEVQVGQLEKELADHQEGLLSPNN